MLVTIIAERVKYLDADGKLITESLRDYSKRAVTNRFASLDTFLQRWNAADRKQAIIDELEEEGLRLEPLADEVNPDLDPFDLICHVAYGRPPLTRRERAENVRKRDVFAKYGPQARAVLDALLQKYQDEGVVDLGDPRILQIPPIDKHRHAGGADPAVRLPGRFRTGSARTAGCALRGAHRLDVSPQHGQVDPGHHAPGRGVDGDAQRISQLCWMFFLKILDDQDRSWS